MLADFFQYDFLRYTFLTGLLIGVIAPLLGTFIVVRRLSLIADALSHVTLAGIAFGLMAEKKFGLMIGPLYSGMAFPFLDPFSSKSSVPCIKLSRSLRFQLFYPAELD